MKTSFLLIVLIWLISSVSAIAADSLSYSGRLVNTNGSPVTGPVNLQFKLSYTDAPAVAVCTKTVSNVALTNGVFHTKLDFTTAECGGTLSLMQVLSAIPLNESVAVQVTDLSHSKTYSYQAVHSVPTSLVSSVAKTLDQMGAANGEYLKWNGTKWIPGAAGTGSGSVTQIDTGTGLSGGPITGTGTISIANGGVDTLQLASGAVTDAKVAVAAAITRSKLAIGTPNYVLVNDGSGVMSGVASLPVGQGGTGATTVPGIWTVLGLGTAAGKDVGNNIGNVMAADVVPSCLPFEKLQMSLAPYQWTCVTDANTDTTKLPLVGGTMAGDIDMDGNQITNLSSPIVGSDAANKTYVDAAVSGSSVWAVGSGNAYRASGNVGVGTPTPSRNVEILNSDTDEALRVSRAANGSDEATIGFSPSGALSSTNQSWKVGLPVNSNSLSFSAFDGSSTSSVLLLSPVGMVIPRLTTAERDAVVSPVNGLQIYNTSSNEINYYNGTAWKVLGVAGSGVTSLVAGTGLTGGTITSSGTIAVDVGTGPNKIVQLNGSSQLPAVDGSNLTNLDPTHLSASVPITKGGTGLAANGAANTVVGMNNAGTAMEYKVISGTGVTVTNGAGTMNFAVTGAPPIGSASGDLSGTYPAPTVVAIQGTPVSSGPASGNILLYNGSAYAPTAVSGDATVSSAGVVTLATVPVTKGGTGVTSLTGKGIVSVNAAGTALVSTVCGNMEVLSFNGSGDAGCSPISSLVATSFIQNGNSFGAAAVLGTNDSNSLNFETAGSTKMTILPSGFVGIGTSSPNEKLSIIDDSVVPGTNIFTVQNTSAAGAAQFSMRNNTSGTISFSASGSSYASIPSLYNKGMVSVSGSLDALQFMTNGDLPTGGSAPVLFSAGGYSNGPTMTITPGNPGNVGIGNTNPVAKLEIQGSSTSNFDGVRIGNAVAYGSGAQTSSLGLGKYELGGWQPMGQLLAGPTTDGNSSEGYLAFYTRITSAPTEKMRITNLGRVGIGTETPSYKLHVVDNTASEFVIGNSLLQRGSVHLGNPSHGMARGPYGVLSDVSNDNDVTVYTTDGSLNISTGAGGSVVPRMIVDASGNITAKKNIRLSDTGSNFVEIRSPATLAASYALTLPATAGTSGYALTTNGSGVLAWSEVATTTATVGGDLSGTIANAQIVAGAVGTSEIANGSVTYAKLGLADGDIPFSKISPFTTTNVPEGTNYYFTDARVSAALMSSYAVGTAIPLATTDTLNQALGKLEAQITANNTANGDMWEKNSPSIYYNDGSVGIGTNSPSDKLQVVGTGRFSEGTGNVSIIPDYLGQGMIQSFQSAGVWRPLVIEGYDVVMASKGGAITMSTNRVDVGVDAGTTMPAYGTFLQFLGATNNSDPFWMARYNVAGNTSELRMNIGDDPGGAFDSFTVGVTTTGWIPLTTFKSDGNVGFGTTNPVAKVHSFGAVDGAFNGVVVDNRKTYGVGEGTTEESRLVLALSETTASDPLSRIMGYIAGGTESEVSSGNGYLALGSRINGVETERVRINSSGFVGIGTINPTAPLEAHQGQVMSAGWQRTVKLVAGHPAIQFKGLADAGHSSWIAHDDVSSTGGLSFWVAGTGNDMASDATRAMAIRNTGNVGIGTNAPSEKLEVNGNAKATAFLYTSDKRLKKDIKPIKNALEKVIALNGVEFIWRKTGESETGLIAQQVETVVPNLVETSAVDGMKSVKYGNIVALLIESTKEQHEQVRKAQREIASLKEENRKLKADIEMIKQHLKIK